MEKKPKLLLLVTLSEWGGAQHVVYLLARHLRLKYDLAVACSPGGELVRRLRGEQVRVVELPELTRNLSPLKDLQALLKLYRWLRRERFDLIHTHSTKAGLVGRLAAGAAGGAAVVFTAHGWAFTEGRRRWQRRLLALMERLAARFCTAIICVSEHDRRLAVQFRVAPPERLIVIHNGIDPQPFLQADGSRVRRELGLREEEPVLAFIGRLTPQKDPLTLLQALRALPRGTALMVGDGPLRSQAERFVKRNGLCGRVIFTGARTDIPDLLAASDLFILSSRWEGLPLVIIEAMMAARPVVATCVGGVPELVEEGVNGFLVRPGDPQALAEAIARLLKDPGMRRRFGLAGQQKALRSFTQDLMVEGTLAVYERLLRDRFAVADAHEQ